MLIIKSRKKRPLGLDELVGQAHNLVYLHSCQIRLRAKAGIADDIEIGKARQTQRFAVAAATRRFKVEEAFKGELRITNRLRSEI